MTVTTAQPLTFPALPFAKLAPSSFLSAHLTSANGPLRPSGRAPWQPRSPAIHTGSLTHAHGSAVVRQGDTAVVCGIRGEILRVEDIPDWDRKRDGAEFTTSSSEHEDEDNSDEDQDEEGGVSLSANPAAPLSVSTRPSTSRKQAQKRKRDRDALGQLNLLVPNVELATGCSPAHLPGGPPSTQAQTLTQRLLTLLHTSDIIRFSDLQIRSPHASFATSPPQHSDDDDDDDDDDMDESTDDTNSSRRFGKGKRGKDALKAFWTLYIDIFFISLSGPAFDAAWLAVLAALRNTLLPNVWWDADRDLIVCEGNAFPRSRGLAVATSEQGESQGKKREEGEGREEGRRLRLRDTPIALSFGVAWEDGSEGAMTTSGSGGREDGGEGRRKWVLVDLDGFEESLCAETAMVVLGEEGRMVRIEKNGGCGADMKEIREVVGIAEQWRVECTKLLDGVS